MEILAIDPGSEQSALVLWNGARVLFKEILPNHDALERVRVYRQAYKGPIVCEKIASYGMPVGAEVFLTCFWTGRFWQVAQEFGPRFHLMPRLEVKRHICHDSKAKDSNIRTALIDRFGQPHTFREEPRFGAKGQPIKPERVKVPGVTYELHDDLWAAFALGVTAYDNISSLDKFKV